MFKTLNTNRRDILAILVVSILLYVGIYFARTVFPPLVYVLDIVHYVAIASLVFFGPWFFISITLPKTMGRFVNVWFEDAWKAFGKPDDFKYTKAGPNKDALAENKEAKELRVQLLLTLAVYAVLVLAGSVVAFAVFAKGISIAGN